MFRELDIIFCSTCSTIEKKKEIANRLMQPEDFEKALL